MDGLEQVVELHESQSLLMWYLVRDGLIEDVETESQRYDKQLASNFYPYMAAPMIGYQLTRAGRGFVQQWVQAADPTPSD